jgi:hypothetical protein
MSDALNKREPIATLMGQAVEEEGEAHLLAYWLGSGIEIVVTERHGADATVLLSKEQARQLGQLLLDAADQHRP